MPDTHSEHWMWRHVANPQLSIKWFKLLAESLFTNQQHRIVNEFSWQQKCCNFRPRMFTWQFYRAFQLVRGVFHFEMELWCWASVREGWCELGVLCCVCDAWLWNMTASCLIFSRFINQTGEKTPAGNHSQQYACAQKWWIFHVHPPQTNQTYYRCERIRLKYEYTQLKQRPCFV